MSLFHHPARRAPERPDAEPAGFCDVCGAAVYPADVLPVQVSGLELTLHGSCAERLEDELGRVRYRKAHGAR